MITILLPSGKLQLHGSSLPATPPISKYVGTVKDFAIAFPEVLINLEYTFPNTTFSLFAGGGFSHVFIEFYSYFLHYQPNDYSVRYLALPSNNHPWFLTYNAGVKKYFSIKDIRFYLGLQWISIFKPYMKGDYTMRKDKNSSIYEIHHQKLNNVHFQVGMPLFTKK